MSNNFSIKDRLKSFTYAYKGIKIASLHEHNLWIHYLAVITTSLLGLFLKISSNEWIALLFCFGAVISAELFNTAVEKMVDFISPEYNEIAGKIKDYCAGAVLVLALMALCVGGIIFIPKILPFF